MKRSISLCLMLVMISALCIYGYAGTDAESADPAETRAGTNISNPHAASWLTDDLSVSLDSIKRIDEKGVLYEMDYTADYYGAVITGVLDKTAAALSSGCSAFSTYNIDDEFLLCRSYDYSHKDTDGNYTGLNVIIHAAPEGKLKSIGVCDACFIDPSSYFAGALDDGETDISTMMLAPYMCVDGMNEAGLTASLLVVDTKEGESAVDQNTGKERVIPSMLLRYVIDNAHDVEEAVKIAESYDVYSTDGTDLHMYLTDKNGVSAVLEWRKYGDDTEQKLYVTYTNALTNFFVGFDDAQDAYREDGSLKELFSGFENTYNHYKYGYGHGYHRFNTIVATLERFINADDNGHGIRNSTMEESQALDVLRVVSQNPGTEKTSFTQYSALYNLEKLTVTYYMQRNYDKSYTFALN